MMEEKDVRTIVEIAKRAEEKGILASDRLSLIMDLKCVHDEVGLRLRACWKQTLSTLPMTSLGFKIT